MLYLYYTPRGNKKKDNKLETLNKQILDKVYFKSLIKYANIITDVSDEREGGSGIWISTCAGKMCPEMDCHTIHEDTIAECVRLLDTVKDCICPDCESSKKTGQGKSILSQIEGVQNVRI
jgi:hypothetical protein